MDKAAILIGHNQTMKRNQLHRSQSGGNTVYFTLDREKRRYRWESRVIEQRSLTVKVGLILS